MRADYWRPDVPKDWAAWGARGRIGAGSAHTSSRHGGGKQAACHRHLGCAVGGRVVQRRGPWRLGEISRLCEPVRGSHAMLNGLAPRPRSKAMLRGHGRGPCSKSAFQERVSNVSPVGGRQSCTPTALHLCPHHRRGGWPEPARCGPWMGPGRGKMAGAGRPCVQPVCDPLAIRDASDLLHYKPPVLQRCHSTARGLARALARAACAKRS